MTERPILVTGATGYVCGRLIPSLVLRRTPDLAWAVTYSPADASDYFIEKVKNGRYRHGDECKPLDRRVEIIRPKKKPPITVLCFENHHDLLEKDIHDDGHYLCCAWASHKETTAETLKSFFNLLQAKDFEEAMPCFAGLTFAPSYRMITDLGENILYTNLAGGPSERRFSKYYASGLQEWINGRYHVCGQNEPEPNAI